MADTPHERALSRLRRVGELAGEHVAAMRESVQRHLDAEPTEPADTEVTE